MNKGNPAATGQPKNYLCVQALRGVAAILVVLWHAIILWRDRIVFHKELVCWGNGAAGVDVFFVISGFVMAISLPGLAGKRNKAGVFLWRRFSRIVPLYWAATTVKVATLKFFPSLSSFPPLKPWYTVASYLFIPAKNCEGMMYPALGVGWTLSYEMLFYFLFAAALALEISPLRFLAPCLGALAVAGTLRTPAWPDFTSLASTLVIEFLYGVIIAHAVTRRKLPSARLALPLLGAGFAALLLMPPNQDVWRFLFWGLPAAAVVTATVGLENLYGARLPKLLLEIGDASYALYLIHPLDMPVIGSMVSRLHLAPHAALAASIVAMFAINIPAALFIHRFAEVPLMKYLKKRRQRPAEAVAPLPVPAV